MAVIFMTGSLSWAETPQLRFACGETTNFPDYFSLEEIKDPQKPGAAIQAINLLAQKLNLNIVIKRTPWKRRLIELKAGELDGIFLGSYEKEREEFGLYPMKNGEIDTNRRFSTRTYVFYKLKNSPIEWDGKKLIHLSGSIGACRGYSIVEDLNKLGYSKIEEVRDTLTLFKKLSLGRNSLCIDLEDKADYVLHKNPGLEDKIVKLATPFETKPYYLMLSKQFVQKNSELSERIWDALAQIRDNEYEQFRKLYFED